MKVLKVSKIYHNYPPTANNIFPIILQNFISLVLSTTFRGQNQCMEANGLHKRAKALNIWGVYSSESQSPTLCSTPERDCVKYIKQKDKS